MSQLELFESEKQRIIKSCFSELDQHGQLAESYIMHVRVRDYPSYLMQESLLSAPSDRTTDLVNERFIIIAVRSNGMRRIHKARENPNKSFSIGKTWLLGDLTMIELFSDSQEARHKEWAGDVGFIVTFIKTCYWKADTMQEKETFLKTLFKIYYECTGRLPALRGSNDAQKTRILPKHSNAAGIGESSHEGGEEVV